MNADLGISASAFGLGAGLFFIGYFIFAAIQTRAPTLYTIRLLVTMIDGAVVPGEDVTGDCGRI